MKYVKWTNKQIVRLRECYPKMPMNELIKEFAPHPWGSIRGTAQRYKIRRRGRCKDWKAVCKEHVMQSGWFEAQP
jgi:hypothetical protein